jgi:uncharacterized protein (TIGR02246 family)
MNRTTIALVLGAALALTGHAQPSKDKGAQALRDLEAQWVKEFDAKDVAKMVAHYADDATLMGPGMPVATGKDAIRATIQEMVSDPNLSLHFQPQRVEIARSGEMGFTQGMYHMTMTDPKTKQKVSDQGSYVTVYRKQADGSWKAVSDIASSGPPMSTR